MKGNKFRKRIVCLLLVMCMFAVSFNMSGMSLSAEEVGENAGNEISEQLVTDDENNSSNDETDGSDQQAPEPSEDSSSDKEKDVVAVDQTDQEDPNKSVDQSGAAQDAEEEEDGSAEDEEPGKTDDAAAGVSESNESGNSETAETANTNETAEAAITSEAAVDTAELAKTVDTALQDELAYENDDSKHSDIEVRSFDVSLYSGADQQSDGTWTVTPSENKSKLNTVSYKVHFSLSGGSDHKPGTIVIRIPSHIFYTREGKPADTFSIDSIPKAPDVPSGDIAYNWTTDPDTGDILLVNCKEVSSASETTFYPSYIVSSACNPSDIKDQGTASFTAKLDVKNDNGEEEAAQ